LLIQQLEANDMAAISQAVVDYTGLDARFFSDGMNRSVQCRERYPFDDRAAIEAAKADPNHIVRALASRMLEDWDDCGVWAVPAADAAEDNQVVTDKPTLVLAGELDPITPPAWGETTAAALPQATYVFFPGEGHGLTPTRCGESIVQAFFDNPGAPPPTGCVGGLDTPDWL
jgi:pimeloyl-ACP methyl ester carboxylesterase